MSDSVEPRGALRLIAALLSAVLLGTLVGALPLTAVEPVAPFSVEQILSSPFPSGLVAAPSGGHVAWVFQDRGVRNVWVASPPDFRGRAVTSFDRDDGQEIAQLAWSDDALRIAFVRGGPSNRAGELPNPLSDPAGVERAVWWIDLAATPPAVARLAEGGSPLFLRDGSAILFARQGKVFRRSLDAAPPTEVRPPETQPPEETESGAAGVDAAAAAPSAQEEALVQVRGGATSLRLSPDGSQLLFVSSRGSHSFVGLYDFATKRIDFLDPGVDRDFSPVFSPDGTRVAYVRVPASTRVRIFEPEREGPPWSIRVVELATGRGREVFRAEPGRGSVFRAVEAETQLVWTADGFLVFPWEREGWTHLYSVPVAGGAARLLTTGAFEVEYVTTDADRRGVVYSSNQGDIDRRHLWRVAASGGAPVAVTSGNGVENVPAVTSEGHVAFLRADGKRPLLPAIRVGDVVRDLAPDALPADFPLAHLVEPEPVVFAASDGLPIHGQLFRPPASFTGPRPAAVFFHGGSRRHMMLGWHYSSYYHNCYAFHQLLASRGFVVLSVNYRSGTGYGLEFREALDYGATGASELHDVLGAALYLRSRPDVRADAIGLWGGSYGGYLTAMGLSRASDLYAAGVDIHGVHDWNRTIQNFVPSYDPLEDPARAGLAFESSPLAQVENWRSPVLLVHGDDDRNVPFLETVELVEKLRQHGVEHEILVFPDEVHSFLVHANWVEIFERSAEFLARHLVQAAAALEAPVVTTASGARQP
ncbi:MAG TPA: prolyl oligopeptidase family serine peptidase [Thermoanaerobaculia bacterium]|nr:prolyl oligopeptidase family serine peptidase [Thermoanaerobaculia bacterium]